MGGTLGGACGCPLRREGLRGGQKREGTLLLSSCCVWLDGQERNMTGKLGTRSLGPNLIMVQTVKMFMFPENGVHFRGGSKTYVGETPLSTNVSLIPATWGLGAQLCLAVLQPNGLGLAVSFLQRIFPIQGSIQHPCISRWVLYH